MSTSGVPDPAKTAVPASEKLKLWVRAGGTCTICKAYLLESPLTAREVTRGEFAHNVGRKRSRRSPRGMDPLSVKLRDTADNALLLCESCHGAIDDPAELNDFAVAKLFELKAAHEAFVRDAVGRSETPRTVVLRLRGSVRDVTDDLDRNAATSAVLASSNRFPKFPFAGRDSVEIDIRAIAGESEADAAYYGAAKRKIDAVIDNSLRPALIESDEKHLSVFAFARLPLLVYLGARLDDSIATDVYQRHRETQAWAWPQGARPVEFRHRCARRGVSGTEAVLLVNASGTVQLSEAPTHLQSLPAFVLEPVAHVPHADTFTARETLISFERALRQLLGMLEAEHKDVTRLHVLAAAPLSAAVTLGRSVGWGIHPSLAVYDRVNGEYAVALEVDAR